MKKGKGAIQVRLDKWLLPYRTAPHSVTGISPARRFLGRTLKTRLDLLFPSHNAERFKFTELKTRQFEVGDLVWARDYVSSDFWRKGKVVEVTRPLTYIVQVQGKDEWRRLIDQMRLRVESLDSVLNGQGTGMGRWPTQNVTPYAKVYTNQESNNDPDELASDHAGSARHQPFADGAITLWVMGTTRSCLRRRRHQAQHCHQTRSQSAGPHGSKKHPLD